jgi:hypothetical protein
VLAAGGELIKSPSTKVIDLAEEKAAAIIERRKAFKDIAR